MVIYSRKKIKKSILKKEETIEKPAIVKEEVKLTLDNEEIVPKKKKYKKPTVVVEETPIVVEDVKIEEEIDLSEWLKDDINE